MNAISSVPYIRRFGKLKLACQNVLLLLCYVKYHLLLKPFAALDISSERFCYFFYVSVSDSRLYEIDVAYSRIYAKFIQSRSMK
jgi:hypothetical protein